MSDTPPPAPVPEPLPEVQPALPRDVSFTTTPYAPEGGFSPVGLVILLVGLSIAGIVLGVITHYVSRYFYLILLFPMLIGIAIGAVGAGLVKVGKIRTPWLAGIAGLLAGILAMLTQHYLDYRQFNEEVLKDKVNLQLGALMAPAGDRELIKRALAVNSFFSYIDFKAHEGVQIKRARGGANDKGSNLGYVGTYIYWAVETLIVAGIVFSMTRKPALEPFCPITNEWKTARCGDNFNVPQELGIDAVADTLKEGALGKLAEVKAHGANSPQNTIPVRLYVFGSPQHTDQGTLDAKLVQFIAGKNGQTEEKQVVIVSYPMQALASFEALCGVA